MQLSELQRGRSKNSLKMLSKRSTVEITNHFYYLIYRMISFDKQGAGVLYPYVLEIGLKRYAYDLFEFSAYIGLI